MKQILINKKLNNKGSSLMFVLIAIAFVSILTAVIISAAATNYRLKIMNNRTQKTFYSAEVAVEEVYAGFGKTACDTLEEEYLNIAKNLTTTVPIEGVNYSVNIDNVEANKELKRQFFSSMHGKLAGVGVDTNEVLSAYLTDPAGAKVISHGTIMYENNDTNAYLIIPDVVISYKEGGYDYYSTVAVDIHVNYPAEEIDFISNTKSNLQTFLEYSIIAMEGINVGGPNAGDISNGGIAGGVYAGSNGINIGINSKLILGERGNINHKSQIVTPGNIVAYGDLEFSNGDLWCSNINVGSQANHEITASFDTNTRLFVSDDLNIEGNDCFVTLGSEYIGYGSSGTVDGGSSSAIIINGRNNKFSATSLSKFVLAGRAYLNFDSDTAVNYMTADSLGIKGIQKIYLVPLTYMNQAEGYSMDVTNPTSDMFSVDINLNDFFAKELLNDTNPYVVKQIDDVYYFYLNFKDTQSQRKYVKCIINDAYFNSNITNKGPNYVRDRENLMKHIENNMDQFIIDGVVNVGFQADAKFYTAGNLYEITGGVGGTMGATENSNEITDINLWCRDKDNRFAILNSYLYDIGRNNNNDTAYAAMPGSFYILGHLYSTNDVADVSAYERILDIPALERRASTDGNYIDIRPDGTISAVIVSGTYTVPDNVVGGVIVAYNESVIVKNSFEGLILTNKTVTTMTDSGELITDGVRDVASRILDEDLILSQYFYAYQMQTSDNRFTSEVEVEDVLSFENWRKNYAE